MLASEYIKNAAERAGFDLCGITRCRHLSENERVFRQWLADGRSGGLDYLERNIEKRFDPSKLVAGARSAIVCAVSYKNAISDGYPSACRAKIASYACTTDYHSTIKQMLFSLLAKLKEQYPTLEGRAFTDSAPLAEKQLAVDAGLGWTGRQSLLVTPQYGTFVLLGELIVSEEVDRYDSPVEDGCGECRRCVEACPAGALLATRSADASKCISRATVEARQGKADDAVNLHGWIFGCDECQSCCPYNRRAPQHRNSAFDMLFDPRTITADNWDRMSDEEFRERFGTTPLMRSGLAAIKENAAK